MSNEILDDFRPEKSAYYAKKAYRFFLITATFFVIPLSLVIIFPPSEKSQEALNFLSGLSFIISFFTGLIGLGYGIRSFKKKEQSNQKYIGIFGNLFFVSIFGLILLANLTDMMRFLTA